jgi:hypothetical protein
VQARSSNCDADYAGREVASQKSATKRKRRERSKAAPRAVRSERREQIAQRKAVTERQRKMGERTLGTVGERPPNPFGGVPVSEIAILLGGIAFVVGLVGSAPTALYVGIVVLGLGVLEVTAREHFSGYRSHTTLLAGIPTVAVEFGLVTLVGSSKGRPFVVALIVPLFACLFFLFRGRFKIARQRRVARR